MLMGCGIDFTIQFGLYAVIVIGVVKATMDVSDVCDRHLFLIRFTLRPLAHTHHFRALPNPCSCLLL